MSAPIRAVILDYGEVLCLRPSREEFEYMAALLGQPLDEFLTRYPAVRLPYDQGAIGPEQYWARVAGDHRVIEPVILDSLRRHDVEIYSRIDPAMEAWIPRLQQSGIRVALLSNMPVDMAAWARASLPWLRTLDYVVLSCEHNLIKPSREIYELCLRGLGAAAHETLFIDDRAINTEAAEAAGLRALLFHSVDQLRTDLAARGFPVLP